MLPRAEGSPVSLLATAGLDSVAIKVRDDHVVTRNLDNLVLAQFEGMTRVCHKGGNIGSEEVFAFTETNDQGGVATSSHNNIHVISDDSDEGERPIQASAGTAHRLRQVSIASR